MINLDPANENILYDCDIDVIDFISVTEVMDREQLGPNGALLFCMEHLENNLGWLLDRLDAYPEGYFIFDLPGQVELTTCHPALFRIIRILEKRHFRLAVVHLSDSTCCIDPSKYIAMLIITLKTMLQLESPQVNVLSKIDLVESGGPLPLRLDYYLDVDNLRYLLACFEGQYLSHQQLNEAICQLIEDVGILSFVPLAVEDKDCMAFLLGEVDKANGFIFGGLTAGNESIQQAANSQAHRERIIELVIERYIRPFQDPDQGD